MAPAPELLARVAAALAAGAATKTEDLTGLLLALGGEICWQRPRLLHRLSTILEAHQPRMATATTHRFKPAFAGKDFSGFPLVAGATTKLVTAHNLTDEDVSLMQRNGGAHLLEPIGDSAEPVAGATDESTVTAPAKPAKGISHKKLAGKIDYDKLAGALADEFERRYGRPQMQDADGVETTNSGILQTATEEHGDSTVVKHSSGGPDDLPITAPTADQEAATLPEAKPQPELAPAPPAPEEAPKKKKH